MENLLNEDYMRRFNKLLKYDTAKTSDENDKVIAEQSVLMGGNKPNPMGVPLSNLTDTQALPQQAKVDSFKTMNAVDWKNSPVAAGVKSIKTLQAAVPNPSPEILSASMQEIGKLGNVLINAEKPNGVDAIKSEYAKLAQSDLLTDIDGLINAYSQQPVAQTLVQTLNTIKSALA